MSWVEEILDFASLNGVPVPSTPGQPPTTPGQITKFFKSEIVRSLLIWQVAGQLIAPLLAPIAQAESDRVWEVATSAGGGIPLSPAELALAKLRGNLQGIDPYNEAGKSGTDGKRFDVLYGNTGEPISIEQALFLLRRGKVNQDFIAQVVRESRLRPEYLQCVLDLQTVPLSPSDVVDAAVENQMTYLDAASVAFQSGVTPEDFDTLFHTRGRPPGPMELLELVRRGIIPEQGIGKDVRSLEQGISESAIKDKWIPAYYALREYLPPPRTVTALERAGAITPEYAHQLYMDAGLSDQLATAYSLDATKSKTARVRELTESQLLTMYRSGYLDAATTTSGLEVLGYTAHEIATLLGWEDVQRQLKAVNAAIAKLQALYVAHKIGRNTVTHGLNQLGLPSAQVEELLVVWTLEREAKVATLSAATIAEALKEQIIDQDQAMQALSELGYVPWDAWLYLSVHLKVALPNPPAPGGSVSGVLP